MITVSSNPAFKLPFSAASATILFSTDGTPPIQTTATNAAKQANLTVVSSTGILTGDFLAVENGNNAGTGPWVACVMYAGLTATNVPAVYPASMVALSGNVVNRFERIETRYRARKITLTNLTNGDVYVWDTTLLDNQAYKTSGGTTSTISDGILSRSNCVAIHPNLLPINSSFSLKCDYDYHL